MIHRTALLLTLLAALGSAARAQDEVSAGSPPVRSEQRFQAVPDFAFTDARGRQVTRADLLGSTWVAIPFFVRCTGPCPNLTTRLRAEVFEPLEKAGVRMVSFSVDPQFDTPEQLLDYTTSRSIDVDRWWFLTGDEAAMSEFVTAGLGMPLMRDDSLEPGEAITHSTRLAVVDPEGRVAGWYECADDSLSPEAIDANFALLVARAGYLETSAWERNLPLQNAILNGTSAVLLVLGLIAIRRGRRERHANLMRAAFGVSAAFLAGYLWYHLKVIPLQGGPTRFHGEGLARVLYLALLASHVILAAVNLPMILRTLWLAHREDWVRHRVWARWTFPIWMYVSVTGVLVYLVLYPWNPAP